MISSGRFSSELGFHPGHVHEWWYLNSHLASRGNRRFGVAVIFFQRRLVFMISDKDALVVLKRYEKSGVLGSAREGLNISFDSSRLMEVSRGSGKFELLVGADDAELSLSLTAKKSPVALNGGGKVSEGVLGHSWYFALTNLEAHGVLKFGGEEHSVAGGAWLDKQWGNWDFGGMKGWDWFSLQLRDGNELLILEPLHPLTGHPVSRLLTIDYGDSSVRTLSKFATRATERWTSPRTGISYGSAWEIVAPGTRLTARAHFGDQEVHEGLWEGCCQVEGILENRPVTGEGYVEQLRRMPFASPGRALLELWTAPLHYAGQRLFLRENLGLGGKLTGARRRMLRGEAGWRP